MEQTAYNNCRNCSNRFDCLEKEDTLKHCDNYVFDEEAATCDDCTKKDTCENYEKGKVTCIDWEPILTCESCTKKETCKSYIPDGKTCENFEVIRYELTHKGMFYLALIETNNVSDANIDIEALMESEFFDTFESKLKLYGLLVYCKNNVFGKIKRFFKAKFSKPEKTFFEVFSELACCDKYYPMFGNSESIVRLVFSKYAELVCGGESK